MIDGQLMEQAIKNVAERQLKERLREWFLWNAPQEIKEVYDEYMKLVEEQDDIKIDE